MEEGVTLESMSAEDLKKEKLFQQGADEGYPHPEWIEFGDIVKEPGSH